MRTLLCIASLIASCSMAADFPEDLVGAAPNNAGGSIFFSTYQKTKTGLECTGSWHVVLTTLPAKTPPDDRLYGCWAFEGVETVDVIWSDGTASKYPAKDITLADWFMKQYPSHHQAQQSIVPSPNDTIF
jgi:hypothetical protein